MSFRMAITLLCCCVSLTWPVTVQRAGAQTTATVIAVTRPGEGSVASSVPATVRQHDSVPPLERRVSLDLQNTTVGAALREIVSQSGIDLVYSGRVVPVKDQVSVKASNVTVRAALKAVLEGTGVAVRATEGRIILSRPSEEKTSRRPRGEMMAGEVFGVVVDSTTERPLQGVEVSVEGTGIKAVTNERGRYDIPRLPAGRQVLTARLLGYAKAEREVTVVDSQRVRVNFALRMAMSRLQEVVTTATGKRQRLELGNDIVVINADSVVATQPVSSVTDLLEGRVPGLVVQRTSGAPGDPSRLRLRGVSSVYRSNDPILIVDGVRFYAAQSDERNTNLAGGSYATPSPLDYLDPNSIETIEVLKGPSAATLYGADAANGVIVITTKKGQSGPPQWTASIDHGITTMLGEYPEGYVRWGHHYTNNTPTICFGYADRECMVDSLVRFQTLNDPALTMLDQGQRTAANVNVSGGSRALQYSVTGSASEELGLVRLPAFEVERFRTMHGTNPPERMQRPQKLSRWGVSSRLTAQLGDKADISLTGILSRTHQQRSSLERELPTLMTTYVERTTGTYYGADGDEYEVRNALLTDYYQRATDEATTFTNGLSLNWRPQAWLTVNADAGINVIQRADELLLPRGMLATRDSVGEASIGRGTSQMRTVNLRASMRVPMFWGVQMQLATGANYRNEAIADVGIRTSNLAVGVNSIDGAEEIGSVSERRREQATFGWYVEPRLHYRHLWLSTGLRLDGGSAFGSRARLASFPKVSLSWLASSEPFFPLQSLFSTLRLRVAYGHAGVQPGPADRLRLYSPERRWMDGELVDAAALETVGNTKIRPERSTEIEAGFDAYLFNDRLSVSFTGYRKTRVDALMEFPLPPSVAGSDVSILRNVGVIRNTGLELTVGTQLVRSDLVTWGTQLSLSQNRNMVVELGQGVEPFEASDGRVAAGYPLFGRWEQQILDYQDLNDDGVLNEDEVLVGDTAIYLGAPYPDYTAALHTTLSFFRGALSLSASMAYEDGLNQINEAIAESEVFWRGSNDPSASLGEQAAAVKLGVTRYGLMQTVSTLRFNSLSLAYHLPSSVAQRLGARGLTVALQGTNLGLITNYRGNDPNVDANVTGNAVADTGILPRPRTWQVRVSARY